MIIYLSCQNMPNQNKTELINYSRANRKIIYVKVIFRIPLQYLTGIIMNKLQGKC